VNVPVSIAFALYSMVGFGFADFFTKIVLSKSNAVRIALQSQAIGTILFFGIAMYYDLVVPDYRLITLTLLSGILSGIILCSYYAALSLAKASLVAPTFSCLNVVAVVLSILILGETLSVLQICLIACVIAGILLVAFKKSDDPPSRFGILLSLLAAIMAGGNVILQKWIAGDANFLMGFLLMRLFMLGTMTAILRTFGEGKSSVAPGHGQMTVLGLVDTTAFFGWYIGLRYGLVSIVTPIANSSPFVTVILAHIFLGERIDRYRWVGIVAILVGITLLVAISP